MSIDKQKLLENLNDILDVQVSHTYMDIIRSRVIDYSYEKDALKHVGFRLTEKVPYGDVDISQHINNIEILRYKKAFNHLLMNGSEEDIEKIKKKVDTLVSIELL